VGEADARITGTAGSVMSAHPAQMRTRGVRRLPLNVSCRWRSDGWMLDAVFADGGRVVSVDRYESPEAATDAYLNHLVEWRAA
jgi:hypothetical protein